MERLEVLSFNVATVLLAIAAVSALFGAFALRRAGEKEAGTARLSGAGLAAIITALSATLFLTLSIISRAVITGHGPFSSTYEFCLAFAWGVLVIGFFFYFRYRTFPLVTVGTIISLAILLFARALPSRHIPLVPALQQSFLLTAHVAAAVVAYGALTTAFATALLYLLKNWKKSPSLPEAEALDEMSYHAVLIGFPFMTLLIVLGALWADVAWGRYWSWDPKETASLVTWLLYAGYLHARVLRGWRGTRTAVLLIIGFFAIIFTLLGNFIFQGLHSY